MASIIALKRKRTDIKTRLTKYKTFLNSAKEKPDTDLIQTKLDALIKHFESIYAIHDQLVEIDADAQEAHYSELDSMEEDYYVLLADTRRLLLELENAQSKQSRSNSPGAPSTSASVTGTLTSTPVANLPEIKLQKFDGNIENWRSFRDKFISKVDSNKQISSVDKLYNLQSCLTGKAARSIEAIECTAENYKEAWTILENKYDNSRKAILKHWSILHELPRLQKDTPAALEDLTDTFRQHIRALKGLGEPVDQFDSCIIYILTSKISDNTLFQWETTLPDNKMPKYTSLLEFLEKRGSCSEHSSTGTKDVKEKSKEKSRQQNQPRGKTFLTKSSKRQFQCPICQQSHSIYRCNSFRAMSHSLRKQAVNKASLCPNCLKFDHGTGDCTGGLCLICDEKHNTLLHPTNTTAVSSSSAPERNTRNESS